jgi:hypothetical protein
MKRGWTIVPVLALTAAAQPKPNLQIADAWARGNPEHNKRPNELALFFGNGLGLAFHTVSSGGQAHLSMAGQVSTQGANEAWRVVLDKGGAVLFAYMIQSDKSAGEMRVQLRPVDQAQLRRREWFPKNQPSGDVATLAVPRDFPALRLGDSVQLDILYHPQTGERISDVLRVITEGPAVGQLRVTNGERFSFERVRVVIDGRILAERDSWMVGRAIKMRIPGHGEYYLLLAPAGGFAFEPSGWVDGRSLRFKAGGEAVEIVGKNNLLQHANTGTVWVYHVPESQVAQKTTAVDFTCADNMNQLLGRE